MKIPEWIIEGLKEREKSKDLLHFLKSKGIVTICEEAQCPNIGTCFSKKTATFLIMGPICTRNCSFCAVMSGTPEPLDVNEPINVAETVRTLGIRHAVITSVTRDDLEDGGANHFIKTIEAVRKCNNGVTIEVLVPDFNGNITSLDRVIEMNPDVLNHNIETVKELFKEVRPRAVYNRSLELLKRVSQKTERIVTKSGMMVGLGETEEQVYETLDDLIDAGVKILTIGQYLRPTSNHHDVERFITPEEFNKYEEVGLEKGFVAVASAPFVRSSFKAEELYKQVSERMLENRRMGESVYRRKDKEKFKGSSLEE